MYNDMWNKFKTLKDYEILRNSKPFKFLKSKLIQFLNRNAFENLLNVTYAIYCKHGKYILLRMVHTDLTVT